MKLRTTIAALLAGLAAGAALADINVGVTLSATGPAASLGIPEKNTIALMPKTIAGQKVNYIVLDDASDTTGAVSNTRKLIADSKVDIVLGSTVTPNSLAMIDVVAEAQVPMISMAASRASSNRGRQEALGVQDAAERHHDVARDRRAHGQRGREDGRLHRLLRRLRRRLVRRVRQGRRRQEAAARRQRALLAHRHLGHRAEPQALSRQPDAVLVALRYARPALPQKSLKERGLRGQDLPDPRRGQRRLPARRAARTSKGTLLPAGSRAGRRAAARVAPGEEVGSGVRVGLRGRHGKGSVSTFGAHAWDTGVLLSAAVPVALKKAQPGTPEFRGALRDALEQIKEVPGAHGIFTMSPTDHLGLDQRARVIVKIENGAWKYQPQP
jgi:branched-chain amino acid transport system substrate-binding protein